MEGLADAFVALRAEHKALRLPRPPEFRPFERLLESLGRRPRLRLELESQLANEMTLGEAHRPVLEGLPALRRLRLRGAAGFYAARLGLPDFVAEAAVAAAEAGAAKIEEGGKAAFIGNDGLAALLQDVKKDPEGAAKGGGAAALLSRHMGFEPEPAVAGAAKLQDVLDRFAIFPYLTGDEALDARLTALYKANMTDRMEDILAAMAEMAEELRQRRAAGAPYPDGTAAALEGLMKWLPREFGEEMVLGDRWTGLSFRETLPRAFIMREYLHALPEKSRTRLSMESLLSFASPTGWPREWLEETGDLASLQARYTLPPSVQFMDHVFGKLEVFHGLPAAAGLHPRLESLLAYLKGEIDKHGPVLSPDSHALYSPPLAALAEALEAKPAPALAARVRELQGLVDKRVLFPAEPMGREEWMRMSLSQILRSVRGGHALLEALEGAPETEEDRRLAGLRRELEGAAPSGGREVLMMVGPMEDPQWSAIATRDDARRGWVRWSNGIVVVPIDEFGRAGRPEEPALMHGWDLGDGLGRVRSVGSFCVSGDGRRMWAVVHTENGGWVCVTFPLDVKGRGDEKEAKTLFRGGDSLAPGRVVTDGSLFSIAVDAGGDRLWLVLGGEAVLRLPLDPATGTRSREPAEVVLKREDVLGDAGALEVIHAVSVGGGRMWAAVSTASGPAAVTLPLDGRGRVDLSGARKILSRGETLEGLPGEIKGFSEIHASRDGRALWATLSTTGGNGVAGFTLSEPPAAPQIGTPLRDLPAPRGERILELIEDMLPMKDSALERLSAALARLRGVRIPPGLDPSFPDYPRWPRRLLLDLLRDMPEGSAERDRRIAELLREPALLESPRLGYSPVEGGVALVRGGGTDFLVRLEEGSILGDVRGEVLYPHGVSLPQARMVEGYLLASRDQVERGSRRRFVFPVAPAAAVTGGRRDLLGPLHDPGPSVSVPRRNKSRELTLRGLMEALVVQEGRIVVAVYYGEPGVKHVLKFGWDGAAGAYEFAGVLWTLKSNGDKTNYLPLEVDLVRNAKVIGEKGALEVADGDEWILLSFYLKREPSAQEAAAWERGALRAIEASGHPEDVKASLRESVKKGMDAAAPEPDSVPKRPAPEQEALRLKLADHLVRGEKDKAAAVLASVGGDAEERLALGGRPAPDPRGWSVVVSLHDGRATADRLASSDEDGDRFVSLVNGSDFFIGKNRRDSFRVSSLATGAELRALWRNAVLEALRSRTDPAGLVKARPAGAPSSSNLHSSDFRPGDVALVVPSSSRYGREFLAVVESAGSSSMTVREFQEGERTYALSPRYLASDGEHEPWVYRVFRASEVRPGEGRTGAPSSLAGDAGGALLRLAFRGAAGPASGLAAVAEAMADGPSPVTAAEWLRLARAAADAVLPGAGAVLAPLLDGESAPARAAADVLESASEALRGPMEAWGLRGRVRAAAAALRTRAAGQAPPATPDWMEDRRVRAAAAALQARAAGQAPPAMPDWTENRRRLVDLVLAGDLDGAWDLARRSTAESLDLIPPSGDPEDGDWVFIADDVQKGGGPFVGAHAGVDSSAGHRYTDLLEIDGRQWSSFGFGKYPGMVSLASRTAVRARKMRFFFEALRSGLHAAAPADDVDVHEEIVGRLADLVMTGDHRGASALLKAGLPFLRDDLTAVPGAWVLLAGEDGSSMLAELVSDGEAPAYRVLLFADKMSEGPPPTGNPSARRLVLAHPSWVQMLRTGLLIDAALLGEEEKARDLAEEMEGMGSIPEGGVGEWFLLRGPDGSAVVERESFHAGDAPGAFRWRARLLLSGAVAPAGLLSQEDMDGGYEVLPLGGEVSGRYWRLLEEAIVAAPGPERARRLRRLAERGTPWPIPIHSDQRPGGVLLMRQDGAPDRYGILERVEEGPDREVAHARDVLTGERFTAPFGRKEAGARSFVVFSRDDLAEARDRVAAREAFATEDDAEAGLFVRLLAEAGGSASRALESLAGLAERAAAEGDVSWALADSTMEAAADAFERAADELASRLGAPGDRLKDAAERLAARLASLPESPLPVREALVDLPGQPGLRFEDRSLIRFGGAVWGLVKFPSNEKRIVRTPDGGKSEVVPLSEERGRRDNGLPVYELNEFKALDGELWAKVVLDGDWNNPYWTCLTAPGGAAMFTTVGVPNVGGRSFGEPIGSVRLGPWLWVLMNLPSHSNGLVRLPARGSMSLVQSTSDGGDFVPTKIFVARGGPWLFSGGEWRNKELARLEAGADEPVRVRRLRSGPGFPSVRSVDEAVVGDGRLWVIADLEYDRGRRERSAWRMDGASSEKGVEAATAVSSARWGERTVSIEKALRLLARDGAAWLEAEADGGARVLVRLRPEGHVVAADLRGVQEPLGNPIQAGDVLWIPLLSRGDKSERLARADPSGSVTLVGSEQALDPGPAVVAGNHVWMYRVGEYGRRIVVHVTAAGGPRPVLGVWEGDAERAVERVEWTFLPPGSLPWTTVHLPGDRRNVLVSFSSDGRLTAFPGYQAPDGSAVELGFYTADYPQAPGESILHHVPGRRPPVFFDHPFARGEPAAAARGLLAALAGAGGGPAGAEERLSDLADDVLAGVSAREALSRPWLRGPEADALRGLRDPRGLAEAVRWAVEALREGGEGALAEAREAAAGEMRRRARTLAPDGVRQGREELIGLLTRNRDLYQFSTPDSAVEFQFLKADSGVAYDVRVRISYDGSGRLIEGVEVTQETRSPSMAAFPPGPTARFSREEEGDAVLGIDLGEAEPSVTIAVAPEAAERLRDSGVQWRFSADTDRSAAAALERRAGELEAGGSAPGPGVPPGLLRALSGFLLVPAWALFEGNARAVFSPEVWLGMALFTAVLAWMSRALAGPAWTPAGAAAGPGAGGLDPFRVMEHRGRPLFGPKDIAAAPLTKEQSEAITGRFVRGKTNVDLVRSMKKATPALLRLIESGISVLAVRLGLGRPEVLHRLNALIPRGSPARPLKLWSDEEALRKFLQDRRGAAGGVPVEDGPTGPRLGYPFDKLLPPGFSHRSVDLRWISRDFLGLWPAGSDGDGAPALLTFRADGRRPTPRLTEVRPPAETTPDLEKVVGFVLGTLPGLTVAERALLSARYVEGLRPGQIAAVRGAPASSTATLLSRALTRAAVLAGVSNRQAAERLEALGPKGDPVPPQEQVKEALSLLPGTDGEVVREAFIGGKGDRELMAGWGLNPYSLQALKDRAVRQISANTGLSAPQVAEFLNAMAPAGGAAEPYGANGWSRNARKLLEEGKSPPLDGIPVGRFARGQRPALPHPFGWVLPTDFPFSSVDMARLSGDAIGIWGPGDDKASLPPLLTMKKDGSGRWRRHSIGPAEGGEAWRMSSPLGFRPGGPEAALLREEPRKRVAEWRESFSAWSDGRRGAAPPDPLSFDFSDWPTVVEVWMPLFDFLGVDRPAGTAGRIAVAEDLRRRRIVLQEPDGTPVKGFYMEPLRRAWDLLEGTARSMENIRVERRRRGGPSSPYLGEPFNRILPPDLSLSSLDAEYLTDDVLGFWRHGADRHGEPPLFTYSKAGGDWTRLSIGPADGTGELWGRDRHRLGYHPDGPAASPEGTVRESVQAWRKDFDAWSARLPGAPAPAPLEFRMSDWGAVVRVWMPFFAALGLPRPPSAAGWVEVERDADERPWLRIRDRAGIVSEHRLFFYQEEPRGARRVTAQGRETRSPFDDDSLTPERLYEDFELMDRFRRALEDMSDEDRAVAEVLVNGGLDEETVAAAVPPEAVERVRARLKDALRDFFPEAGLRAHAWILLLPAWGLFDGWAWGPEHWLLWTVSLAALAAVGPGAGAFGRGAGFVRGEIRSLEGIQVRRKAGSGAPPLLGLPAPFGKKKLPADFPLSLRSVDGHFLSDDVVGFWRPGADPVREVPLFTFRKRLGRWEKHTIGSAEPGKGEPWGRAGAMKFYPAGFKPVPGAAAAAAAASRAWLANLPAWSAGAPGAALDVLTFDFSDWAAVTEAWMPFFSALDIPRPALRSGRIEAVRDGKGRPWLRITGPAGQEAHHPLSSFRDRRGPGEFVHAHAWVLLPAAWESFNRLSWTAISPRALLGASLLVVAAAAWAAFRRLRRRAAPPSAEDRVLRILSGAALDRGLDRLDHRFRAVEKSVRRWEEDPAAARKAARAVGVRPGTPAAEALAALWRSLGRGGWGGRPLAALLAAGDGERFRVVGVDGTGDVDGLVRMHLRDRGEGVTVWFAVPTAEMEERLNRGLPAGARAVAAAAFTTPGLFGLKAVHDRLAGDPVYEAGGGRVVSAAGRLPDPAGLPEGSPLWEALLVVFRDLDQAVSLARGALKVLDRAARAIASSA